MWIKYQFTSTLFLSTCYSFPPTNYFQPNHCCLHSIICLHSIFRPNHLEFEHYFTSTSILSIFSYYVNNNNLYRYEHSLILFDIYLLHSTKSPLFFQFHFSLTGVSSTKWISFSFSLSIWHQIHSIQWIAYLLSTNFIQRRNNSKNLITASQESPDTPVHIWYDIKFSYYL